jgi:predicted RNA-binding protein with PIN domain
MAHYVIDGYNLLLGPSGDRRRADLETLRESLIKKLSLLLQQHRDIRITLVFDGTGPTAEERPDAGPRVVFSGKGRGDDTVLLSARAHPNCIAVTDDADLKWRLVNQGARVLSCGHFLRDVKLDIPEARPLEPEKTGPRMSAEDFGMSADDTFELKPGPRKRTK